MKDCRRGVEMLGTELTSSDVGDRAYWFSSGSQPRGGRKKRVVLAQVYDEYVMSYSDSRDAIAGALPTVEMTYWHVVLLDGLVIGHWKRVDRKSEALIETAFYRPLEGAEEKALDEEVARFGRFLGRPVIRI